MSGEGMDAVQVTHTRGAVLGGAEGWLRQLHGGRPRGGGIARIWLRGTGLARQTDSYPEQRADTCVLPGAVAPCQLHKASKRQHLPWEIGNLATVAHMCGVRSWVGHFFFRFPGLQRARLLPGWGAGSRRQKRRRRYTQPALSASAFHLSVCSR